MSRDLGQLRPSIEVGKQRKSMRAFLRPCNCKHGGSHEVSPESGRWQFVEQRQEAPAAVVAASTPRTSPTRHTMGELVAASSLLPTAVLLVLFVNGD
jgi:hypothetical protein